MNTSTKRFNETGVYFENNPKIRGLCENAPKVIFVSFFCCFQYANGNSTEAKGLATSPDEDMIDINTSGGGERTTRLNEDEDGISHCKYTSILMSIRLFVNTSTDTLSYQLQLPVLSSVSNGNRKQMVHFVQDRQNDEFFLRHAIIISLLSVN